MTKLPATLRFRPRLILLPALVGALSLNCGGSDDATDDDTTIDTGDGDMPGDGDGDGDMPGDGDGPLGGAGGMGGGPATGQEITVTVTGLGSNTVKLAVNGGNEMTVNSDGPAVFSKAFADGVNFEVSLVEGPSLCSATRKNILKCELTGASGTVGQGDEAGVSLDCVKPKYRYYTSSWRTPTGLTEYPYFFTDDVYSYADNATVTTSTPYLNDMGTVGDDALAIDVGRDLAYFGQSGQIEVFADVDNLTTPARTIIINAGDTSLALVPEVDRLYAASGGNIIILDNVSTLDGAVTFDHEIAVNDAVTVIYDEQNDRLFAGTLFSQKIYVFDDASALTSASVPDRTLSWTSETGPSWVQGLEVDPCTDRLYLWSNVFSPDGNRVFVFAGASTIDGPIDLDDDSIARMQTAIVDGFLDDSGNLTLVPDSATMSYHFLNPETLAGDLPFAPDLTLLGTVRRSYSNLLLPYWD